MSSDLDEALFDAFEASQQPSDKDRELSIRGENAILRSQLANRNSKHQEEISELLKQQTARRSDLEKEVNQLKRQLLESQSRSEFATAASKADRIKPALPRPTDASTPAGHTQRKNINRGGDGFVVNRVALPRRRAVVSPTPSPSPQLQAHHEEHTETWRADILRHRIQENSEPTLEQLYRKGEGLTIGDADTSDGALAAALDLLEKPLDIGILALDLVGVLMPHCVPSESTAVRLWRKVGEWLGELTPLPSTLGPNDLVPRIPCYLLSCLLCALDLLMCLDVEYDIPVETIQAALMSHVPSIVVRAAEIMIALAGCGYIPPRGLPESQLFPEYPPKPSIEMLFGGLWDEKPLNAATLDTSYPSYFQLPPGVLNNSFCDHLALCDFYELRSVSVRFVQALKPTSPTAQAAVTRTLVYEVNAIASPAHKTLVSECVLFLWSMLPQLTMSNPDELLVCMASVAQSNDDEYLESTRQQATQVLRDMLDPQQYADFLHL